MTNMKEQNTERSLVQDCQEKNPHPDNNNIDPVPDMCCDPGEHLDPTQKRVPVNPELSWLQEQSLKKSGIGQHQLCDPIQTGQIVNDLDTPNRDVIYRYTKAMRGADEAMLDMFRNTVVIDEQGKAHPIPIVWGSQEKAVAAILQDNVRKDNSLVVDRIRLPMLAIHQSGLEIDKSRFVYQRGVDYLRYLRPDQKPGWTTNEKYERDTIFGVTRGLPVNITYSLYAWTLYWEDMNQIVEQIILKFSPVAYIQVRGVYWESIVKLDSINNNMETEPGDNKLRVLKYQFNMTAQTFIPQPIVRKKAVLKTKMQFVNGVCEQEITEVLDEIEEAVKELEQ
jgi:hypothetical protein